jgi:hypothetical protein
MRYTLAFLLFLCFSQMAQAEADLRAPAATEPRPQDTPQAVSILAPLTNLVTSYKGFRLPAHASICYAPTLQFTSRSYVLNSHCTVLELHRTTIGLIAVLIWAILGFSIIMSA